MKTILFVLAIAVSIPLHAVLAQEPAGGRYVLLAGTATVDDKEEKLIFKIDTVTGQTWKYVVLPLKPGDMNVVAEGWTLLDEDASATWLKLQKSGDAAKRPVNRKP